MSEAIRHKKYIAALYALCSPPQKNEKKCLLLKKNEKKCLLLNTCHNSFHLL